MVAIRGLVERGELGTIFAVDLVFHNGYGPDKPWSYDRAQSGGGCVIDLGVHLVDLALWVLGGAPARTISASLLRHGKPLGLSEVEDFAVAQLEVGGALVRLTCSWNLHVGREVEIAAILYGRDGGAALRNGGGSFYDFTASHFTGTATETLTGPPDDWGGRAAAAWTAHLAVDRRFDPAAESLIHVADVLDGIYAAAGGARAMAGGQSMQAN